MKNKITTIAFDADDTLWVNEPYFQEAEKEFWETASKQVLGAVFFFMFHNSKQDKCQPVRIIVGNCLLKIKVIGKKVIVER